MAPSSGAFRQGLQLSPRRTSTFGALSGASLDERRAAMEERYEALKQQTASYQQKIQGLRRPSGEGSHPVVRNDAQIRIDPRHF